MSACTFFGHSDPYNLDPNALQKAVEELIEKGVDVFYVGHQGYFDSIVFHCLLKIREKYQHIAISVVLAYLPIQSPAYDLYRGYSIYPERMELGSPRFAIDRRNRWMISRADYCLCYVRHTWGGAYKYAMQAKKKNLTVINLGGSCLENT